jgi:predicted nucleic acid-binding Zn ribbon protein
MRRRAPRPLALALGALADELQPPSTLARVQRVWGEAAGAAVACVCRPTGEREGVLNVTCGEAVWAQELQLIGESVVERVNEALGEPLIKRLRCRTG